MRSQAFHIQQPTDENIASCPPLANNLCYLSVRSGVPLKAIVDDSVPIGKVNKVNEMAVDWSAQWDWAKGLSKALHFTYYNISSNFDLLFIPGVDNMTFEHSVPIEPWEQTFQLNSNLHTFIEETFSNPRFLLYDPNSKMTSSNFVLASEQIKHKPFLWAFYSPFDFFSNSSVKLPRSNFWVTAV